MCPYFRRNPRARNFALAREIISSREASTVCRCTPVGEGGKQRRLRAANVSQKILQVRPRFDHQRPTKFAVKRMLHEHVQNLHAVIDQNLKLLFGPLGRVFAGKNRPERPRRLFRQPISLRRRKNLVSAGAQNRDVLHHALPAHSEVPRQLTALRRAAQRPHPRKHLARGVCRLNHARKSVAFVCARSLGSSW